MIHGNEPITSDPNSLLENIDLDLDEKFEDIENCTMKTAGLETIQYINQQVAKISQNPSFNKAS